jgi:DnaJ domain
VTIAVGRYVIRFLADALQVPEIILDQHFAQMTGYPLPQPSDFSSATWWQARRGGEQNENYDLAVLVSPCATARGDALVTLGLEEGAPETEIHSAYRRLAMACRPDGPSHEGVAESRRKIEEAYETWKNCLEANFLWTKAGSWNFRFRF